MNSPVACRRLLGVVFAFAICAAGAIPAAAHPLGNFTINHLTTLSFGLRELRLRYVLDLAEIPSFQTMREATPDGTMTRGQLALWARSEATKLAPDLRVTGGGSAIPLTVEGASARTRPGAGGLPLLYFTLDAHVALPATHRVAFEDATFAGRLGWHDVVVAPAREPTHALLAYPSALLGSPRDLTAVAITLGAGGRVLAVGAAPRADTLAATGGAPASFARSNQLSDMLARGTGDAAFVLLTLLAAIALGALHALEPGHGKTLLAVSLVGARATAGQATILASALTVAHTAGVIALGIAISLLKGYFVPESIYPWITLLSGVVIAIVGARAVQRQIRLRQPFAHEHAHHHAATHPHDHAHVHEPHHAHDDSHDHGHDHGHDHDDVEHARSHAIPGTAPLTFGGTVLAAMSGGVAPCPAALVVLLAAIALNQVAYGVVVVVAFSLGLAATLTGLGIAVVRGATWLQGRPQFERFVRFGPLVSAVVIATIGAIMVGQGFAQEGIFVSPVLASSLTALAIAGYAVSHGFAHHAAEAA